MTNRFQFLFNECEFRGIKSQRVILSLLAFYSKFTFINFYLIKIEKYM